MTRLLVATRNAGKLVEMQRMLAASDLGGVTVVGLADVPAFPEAPEVGATFAENALAKARDAAARRQGWRWLTARERASGDAHLRHTGPSI